VSNAAASNAPATSRAGSSSAAASNAAVSTGVGSASGCTSKAGAARAGSGEYTAVGAKQSRGDSSDSVVVRRGKQLDEKARKAQRLLDRLPPNDRRRRLLYAAILRRDEILLDGFIEELGGS
jgi:hypothetical protein